MKKQLTKTGTNKLALAKAEFKNFQKKAAGQTGTTIGTTCATGKTACTKNSAQDPSMQHAYWKSCKTGFRALRGNRNRYQGNRSANHRCLTWRDRDTRSR